MNNVVKSMESVTTFELNKDGCNSSISEIAKPTKLPSLKKLNLKKGLLASSSFKKSKTVQVR